jgi:hypothetical protein
VRRSAAILAGAHTILSQAKKAKPQKPLAAEKVFKRAVPSVVAIGCLGSNGAGIGAAGRILTSFHVIQNCRSLTVRLSNGDAYDSVSVVDTGVRKALSGKSAAVSVIASCDSVI